MEPTHQVHEASPASRQKAVMDRLSALQNSHRLAIHMVEHDGSHFQMHGGLMRQLKKADSDDAVKELLEYAGSDKREHYPLHSVSLLPPNNSGWSMCPYQVENDALNKFGYLIDLSQDQPSPPTILTAKSTSFCSGHDCTYKLTMINAPETGAVRKVYDLILAQHPSKSTSRTENKRVNDSKRLISAMCGPNRTDYANQMLDALGSEPPEQAWGLSKKPPQTADYNEVIAAMDARHIAAIAVPVFQSPESEDESYLTFRKLQAALVGLSHLKAGIDLPVVLYHVTPPNKGGLSYVGQGKEELRRVGLEALKEVADITAISEHDDFDFQSCTKPYNTDRLNKNIKKHLGVDLSEGLTGTAGWRAQVDEQLATVLTSSRLQAAPLPDLAPH